MTIPRYLAWATVEASCSSKLWPVNCEPEGAGWSGGEWKSISYCNELYWNHPSKKWVLSGGKVPPPPHKPAGYSVWRWDWTPNGLEKRRLFSALSEFYVIRQLQHSHMRSITYPLIFHPIAFWVRLIFDVKITVPEGDTRSRPLTEAADFVPKMGWSFDIDVVIRR